MLLKFVITPFTSDTPQLPPSIQEVIEGPGGSMS